jgi:hypothetical protein
VTVVGVVTLGVATSVVVAGVAAVGVTVGLTVGAGVVVVAGAATVGVAVAVGVGVVVGVGVGVEPPNQPCVKPTAPTPPMTTTAPRPTISPIGLPPDFRLLFFFGAALGGGTTNLGSPLST